MQKTNLKIGFKQRLQVLKESLSSKLAIALIVLLFLSYITLLAIESEINSYKDK
jgi:hypothetical protein